ncbi:hypothetical protein [uncultured Cellulomonas sp.]|uniref:hypothetical protein n=1 Tax=uncultured Cellulomonas sp. TaxID=189682 RepID=UPI002614EF8E|nr:hypothetical protein [uncultured Cellulomonas sp.]
MVHVEVSVADGGNVVVVRAGEQTLVRAVAPVQVETTDGAGVASAYQTLSHDGDALVAGATVVTDDGSEIEISDRWHAVGDEGRVVVRRDVVVRRAATAAGVRWDFAVEGPAVGPSEQWQLFISGNLYNLNDTDLDGREDYLGTDVHEFRDDRNGHLAALAFLPSAQYGLCLARVEAPRHDSAVTPEQLVTGAVIADTDIGSLGVVAAQDGPLVLRAGYPFREERSYCLDTSGRGWAGYLPNETGLRSSVTYELSVVDAPDLTEAIWSVSRRQWVRLGTAPSPLPLPLEEIEAHRFSLTQQYYREWSAADDPREPAGYLTHFSPRDGRTLGSLLEFGFTGAQSLLALAGLRRGHRDGVRLWTDRARRVNDFFVRSCQHDNGFCDGLYDTQRGQFVDWFTGILMPFQYAQDEETLRDYLGSQITDALAPVAARLRGVPGNYTRTMCEAVHAVLLGYEEEKRHGVDQPEWLRAGERFGSFLLATQRDDGSWYRAYSPDGSPLTEPTEWFGKSDLEQGSGAIFPVPVLADLHRLTGRAEYASAALRAADHILRTFVQGVRYCGGLNDTAQIKSVKVDSTGVLFAMRSLITAYRLGGDPRHLDGAVRAAKVASSWLFCWDVPFPEGTLLADADFRTTGWAVCDAIPGGSYVEDVFLEFVGDLLEVARAARVPEFVDVAEVVLHGMQQGVSLPGRMFGYAAPGIQCEGFMTSYWLSAPEATKFSGAVGKVKGDDNDTCNGFVAAAACYGLDSIRDMFATVDFSQIRLLATPALSSAEAQ